MGLAATALACRVVVRGTVLPWTMANTPAATLVTTTWLTSTLIASLRVLSATKRRRLSLPVRR